MERKKINYILEFDILRNSTQSFLGVLRGAFLGFGCPNRHPDALLAKTMGAGDDMQRMSLFNETSSHWRTYLLFWYCTRKSTV